MKTKNKNKNIETHIPSINGESDLVNTDQYVDKVPKVELLVGATDALMRRLKSYELDQALETVESAQGWLSSTKLLSKVWNDSPDGEEHLPPDLPAWATRNKGSDSFDDPYDGWIKKAELAVELKKRDALITRHEDSGHIEVQFPDSAGGTYRIYGKDNRYSISYSVNVGEGHSYTQTMSAEKSQANNVEWSVYSSEYMPMLSKDGEKWEAISKSRVSTDEVGMATDDAEEIERKFVDMVNQARDTLGFIFEDIGESGLAFENEMNGLNGKRPSAR